MRLLFKLSSLPRSSGAPCSRGGLAALATLLLAACSLSSSPPIQITPTLLVRTPPITSVPASLAPALPTPDLTTPTPFARTQPTTATPVSPATAFPSPAMPTLTHAPPAQSAVTPTQIPAGATRVSLKDGAVQLFVPGGPFLLGSSPQDREALPDEQPQRRLSLPDFWIDRLEVSNRQYAACVKAGACRPPYYTSSSTRLAYYGEARYEEYPVILVSWEMARAYCAWVGRRLPGEAEWEKAARGTDGRIYPWGAALGTPTLANFCDQRCPFAWKDARYDDGYPDTAPVDAFAAGASPYGALNMAGNVWEWTADWYAPSPAAAPTQGQQRVLKGGTWFYESWRMRSAARGKADPGYMSNLIGFRCAEN